MLAMDQEELPRALIERKETKVLEILRSSDIKRHFSARGKIGETPLHIATSWPRGMELLLHLGGEHVSKIIDAEDDNGSTALDYALKMNEPDCVRMLLRKSAGMDLENMQNIEKWEQGREKWAIIPILTDALAERRRNLLEFASETVHQRADLASLSIEKGGLLQEDAFGLIQTLLARGVNVPEKFRNVRPGSVYHSAHMNVEMAASLFNSGFDRTAVSFLGFTPLMTVDLVALSRRHEAANLLGLDPGALGLVDWFLSHGEDLGTPIPTSGLIRSLGSEVNPQGPRLVHRIASELGRCLRWPLALSGDRCTALLSGILTLSETDSCSCLCTRGGCSAASVFSRELWGSIRGNSAPHAQPALGQESVRMMLDFLTRRLSGHPETRNFTSSFFRVSTFERLGLSHTCCRFVKNSGTYEGDENGVALAILKGEYKVVEIMDPEDVAEIQEEDIYLAELLEELMQEFDVKFEELGLPLGDFFRSYWWVRMDEVESENKVSREELEALRRTGVVLHGS